MLGPDDHRAALSGDPVAKARLLRAAKTPAVIVFRDSLPHHHRQAPRREVLADLLANATGPQ